MEAYDGSWKIDAKQTKNMEAFLKAAGFPEAMATEMIAREYVVTYKANGDKLSAEVNVANREQLPKKSYVFEMGKEIEIEGVDGDKTNSTVSWDGSKFLERHKSLPGAAMSFDFSMTRELKDGQMVLISTVNGVELYEVYVRC